LRKLEDEINAKATMIEAKLNQDFFTVKHEIDNRLDEVKETLRKAYQRSTKDDKLTKLIKAFLASF